MSNRPPVAVALCLAAVSARAHEAGGRIVVRSAEGCGWCSSKATELRSELAKQLADEAAVALLRLIGGDERISVETERDTYTSLREKSRPTPAIVDRPIKMPSTGKGFIRVASPEEIRPVARKSGTRIRYVGITTEGTLRTEGDGIGVLMTLSWGDVADPDPPGIGTYGGAFYVWARKEGKTLILYESQVRSEG